MNKNLVESSKEYRSHGKKLVSIVENPFEWYGKNRFSNIGAIFAKMAGDENHLMKVDTGDEKYFLGGYILAYALRTSMGSRDEIQSRPFNHQYIDPLRFAQVMHIPPNTIPETYISRKSRINTIERVQHDGKLVYRIPIRTLAHFSLPVVKEKKFNDMTPEDLALEHRVSGEEKYLLEFLERIDENIKITVKNNFAKYSSILGEEIVVSLARAGAEEAFRSFDFTKPVKLKTFMQKHVKGRIIDFCREQDHVSRRIREAQGGIEGVLAEAKEEGRDVELGSLYEMFPKHSRETVERAYELATGRGKITNLEDRSQDSGREKDIMDSPWQELIEDNHPLARSPFEEVSAKDSIEVLLKCLNPDEKEMVVRYYLTGSTMLEIANEMELSESRVSQKVTSILERLRIHAIRLQEKGVELI